MWIKGVLHQTNRTCLVNLDRVCVIEIKSDHFRIEWDDEEVTKISIKGLKLITNNSELKKGMVV
jgi:hypothetical protein